MEQGNDLKLLLNDDLKQKTSFFSHFSFEVISCVYIKATKPWEIKPRISSDTFFLFPIKNSVIAHIDTVSELIDTSHVAFAPQGVRQRFEMPENQEVFEFITVHVLIRNMWGLQLAPFFKKNIHRIPSQDKFQNQLMELISFSNYDKKAALILVADVLKNMFINLILSGAQMEVFNQHIDPRMVRALQTMHENYQELVSIEFIASECRLSPAQFRRVFKQEIGVAPKKYLKEYRLKQATILLRSSKKTIKEIAFAVGYQDEHYFHAQFKKNFGVTPRRYQKNLHICENDATLD